MNTHNWVVGIVVGSTFTDLIMLNADDRTGHRPRKRSPVVRTTPVYPGVVKEQPLRAPRASHVFCTDKKRIRTKNAVIDQSNSGME